MGAAERRKGRRWAIGCGAALGLALLAALVLAGRVWYAQRASDPRADRRVTEVVAGADLAGSAGAARGEPVRILLEMDVGETFVEPAEPGEPLTVEADYDANLYRLEEPRDDPGWDRRLRFRLTGSRVVAGLKEAVYGGQPQVRVRLPRDVPLELKLVQRNGGAFVDVGGLDLRDFQVEFDGAIVKIGADEPLTGISAASRCAAARRARSSTGCRACDRGRSTSTSAWGGPARLPRGLGSRDAGRPAGARRRPRPAPAARRPGLRPGRGRGVAGLPGPGAGRGRGGRRPGDRPAIRRPPGPARHGAHARVRLESPRPGLDLRGSLR